MTEPLIRQAQLMIAEIKQPLPKISDDSLARQVCHELRLVRLNTKLTLNQVAKRMGTRSDVVLNTERFTNRPSLDKMSKLAKALDVELYQILLKIYLEKDLPESEHKSLSDYEFLFVKR